MHRGHETYLLLLSELVICNIQLMSLVQAKSQIFDRFSQQCYD